MPDLAPQDMQAALEVAADSLKTAAELHTAQEGELITLRRRVIELNAQVKTASAITPEPFQFPQGPLKKAVQTMAESGLVTPTEVDEMVKRANHEPASVLRWLVNISDTCASLIDASRDVIPAIGNAVETPVKTAAVKDDKHPDDWAKRTLAKLAA